VTPPVGSIISCRGLCPRGGQKEDADGDYRLKPRAFQVGRARTKGKIERSFFYLDQHFIKGNGFGTFAHFPAELAACERDDLDVRVHATTQQAPLEGFAAEQSHLTPLPDLERARLTRPAFWSYLSPTAGACWLSQ